MMKVEEPSALARGLSLPSNEQQVEERAVCGEESGTACVCVFVVRWRWVSRERGGVRAGTRERGGRVEMHRQGRLLCAAGWSSAAVLPTKPVAK